MDHMNSWQVINNLCWVIHVSLIIWFSSDSECSDLLDMQEEQYYNKKHSVAKDSPACKMLQILKKQHVLCYKHHALKVSVWKVTSENVCNYKFSLSAKQLVTKAAKINMVVKKHLFFLDAAVITGTGGESLSFMILKFLKWISVFLG